MYTATCITIKLYFYSDTKYNAFGILLLLLYRYNTRIQQ